MRYFLLSFFFTDSKGGHYKLLPLVLKHTWYIFLHQAMQYIIHLSGLNDTMYIFLYQTLQYLVHLSVSSDVHVHPQKDVHYTDVDMHVYVHQ